MEKYIFVRKLTACEEVLVAGIGDRYSTEKLKYPCEKKQLCKDIAIVLSSIGNTPKQIAKITHVHSTTVVRWLKTFNKIGIESLKLTTKPGRPRKADQGFIVATCETLKKSPRQFGYNATKWNMYLLREHLYCVTGKDLSLRTLYKIKRDIN